jgi:inward rectifier potassium channel
MVRKFDELDLERRKVAFFPLSWTVVHPIDEKSPLYGMTDADLRNSDAEIMILLSAADETFAQVVHTRTSYKAEQIRVGSKFISIYNDYSEGEPISIDVRKLSLTERAD